MTPTGNLQRSGHAGGVKRTFCEELEVSFERFGVALHERHDASWSYARAGGAPRGFNRCASDDRYARPVAGKTKAI